MDLTRKKAYLKLLLVTVIWGAALPIVKPSLDIISSEQFLFLRFALAAPLLLPFIARKRYLSLIRANLPILIFLSFYNIIIILLLYTGLSHTSSLEASFINNLSPIFITLAGIKLLNEIQESHEWTGLFLAFIGTTIIILEPLFHGDGAISTENFFGNLIILTFVVFDSLFFILLKKFTPHIPKKIITSVISWLGFISLYVYLALTGSLPSLQVMMHPNVILAVLFMGLLGTAIAYILVYQAYQDIETSEASFFTYLRPLVYIPLGVIWLHETITLIQVIGLILALIGVVIAETRRRTHIPLLPPKTHAQ